MDESFLGTDSQGRTHWATMPPEMTIIVDDGDEQTVVELPTHERETGQDIRHVADWVDYIDDRCGWDDNQYDVGLVELLADSVEGQA